VLFFDDEPDYSWNLSLMKYLIFMNTLSNPETPPVPLII
jgi:hypothetical protein